MPLDSAGVPEYVDSIMKYCTSFIPCLVLVHALVATPLLVECFQADGGYLVEILGNDPCHNPVLTNGAEGVQESSTLNDGTFDPCIDLLMDSPGCTRICSDLPLLSLQTQDRTALDPAKGVVPLGILEHFRANPPPSLRSDAESQSPLALRI